MSAAIGTADVEHFRDLVAERTGLHFADDKLAVLEDAMRSRLRAAGDASPAEYLRRAAMSASEPAELVRLLSVNETYFLRNRDQFTVLEHRLRHAPRPTSTLRLVSAGCSSGEEAYSLALVARRARPDLRDDAISIRGLDLDPDALERAHAGVYGAWSLRETPPEIRSAFLTPRGERWMVAEPLRRIVHFEPCDITRPDGAAWPRGSVDVVFCRNVLMYFTRSAARRAVHNITDALRPGGLLFVGHAETLRGLSDAFVLRHEGGTFYYEKRADGEVGHAVEPAASVTARPPSPTPDGTWAQVVADAASRIAALSRPEAAAHSGSGEGSTGCGGSPPGAVLRAAMELVRTEQFGAALDHLGGAAAQDDDARLLRAVLLANSGALEQAEIACDAVLARHDLDPLAHYVKALCLEQSGDLAAAIEHDKIAVYLDPGFAMPHLHLGLLSRRSGDPTTARRELTLARDLFVDEDATRIVMLGGGFGRDALRALCEAELAACDGGRP